jgi:putative transposase
LGDGSRDQARLSATMGVVQQGIEEPETNGAAERFNRTLKEQAIHGRIFRNIDEVRAAVGEFVERYNTQWRLEKMGYKTPVEARDEHALRLAA